VKAETGQNGAAGSGQTERRAEFELGAPFFPFPRDPVRPLSFFSLFSGKSRRPLLVEVRRLLEGVRD
jgi:hypothetical protein